MKFKKMRAASIWSLGMHCACWGLLWSVTMVSTQYMGGGESIQPRYEYMNRTAQIEIWENYFQTMRGMYL